MLSTPRQPRLFPCPKCGQVLKQSGEVCVNRSEILPTFQCDDCHVWVDVLGERMRLPLTFALDGQGTPFDPASPDGRLPI